MSLDLRSNYTGVSPQGVGNNDRLALSCWINIPVSEATYPSFVNGRFIHAGSSGDAWASNTGAMFYLLGGNTFGGWVGNQASASTTVGIPRGVWFHVAFMSDRTLGTTRLYVNGAYKATVNAVRSLTNGYVGLANFWGYERVSCLIAEVGVWQGASLTDADFLKLYTYTPYSVQYGALLAYWPLKTDLADVKSFGSITSGAPFSAEHPDLIKGSVYTASLVGTAGLTAYYPCADAAGTVLSDYKGTAHGTLIGNQADLQFAQDASAERGKCLRWVDTPSTNTYWRLPPPAGLAGDYTLEGWFFHTKAAPWFYPTSGIEWEALPTLIRSNANARDFGINVGRLSGDAATAARVVGGTTASQQPNYGAYVLSSQTTLNDGAFHYVALTRNAASGAMKLYIDGVLSGSAAGVSGGMDGWVSYFFVGGTGAAATQFSAGGIQHVAFYSRELSAGDVQGHYALGLGTTPQSQGCWGVAGAPFHTAQPSIDPYSVAGLSLHTSTKRGSVVTDPYTGVGGGRKRRRRKLNTGID